MYAFPSTKHTNTNCNTTHKKPPQFKELQQETQQPWIVIQCHKNKFTSNALNLYGFVIQHHKNKLISNALNLFNMPHASRCSLIVLFLGGSQTYQIFTFMRCKLDSLLFFTSDSLHSSNAHFILLLHTL